MLKKRIIPKFLIKDGRLVKGVRFHENMREAGNPVATARVYDAYGVDELIFLDIQASLEGRQTVTSIIENVSKEIFMPFTVGGGIKTLDQVNDLLRAGADKVSINTAAIEDPSFVRSAAARFGNQCITVAIDYKLLVNGEYRVYSHCGQKKTDLNPIDWALEMESKGCGEIILCSIDRDGTMSGYDIDMISTLSKQLRVPLIASSGAGSLSDCMAALEAGASAITVSSMFIFTDHSPIKLRSYLSSNHINVRSNWGSRS
jgi:cyclase